MNRRRGENIVRQAPWSLDSGPTWWLSDKSRAAEQTFSSQRAVRAPGPSFPDRITAHSAAQAARPHDSFLIWTALFSFQRPQPIPYTSAKGPPSPRTRSISIRREPHTLALTLPLEAQGRLVSLLGLHSLPSSVSLRRYLRPPLASLVPRRCSFPVLLFPVSSPLRLPLPRLVRSRRCIIRH